MPWQDVLPRLAVACGDGRFVCHGVAGCPSARWSMGLQIAVVVGFDDDVEYHDDCDLHGHHGIDGCVYGVRVLSDV